MDNSTKQSKNTNTQEINKHPFVVHMEYGTLQRSLSIDEPIPSSATNCNVHIPKVSDLHISLNADNIQNILRTVSETEQDNIDKKRDSSECNTNHIALLTPDLSISPITHGHIHTYSNGTTSTVLTSPASSTDHIHAFYLPASPINREQEMRNERYHMRGSCSASSNSKDSILSEHDIVQIMDHVMAECATKDNKGNNNSTNSANNQHKSNASNSQNADQHNKNNENNKSNDEQNDNDPNDFSGFHNNGSNGNNGDDEKEKKEEDKKDTDDSSDEEEEEEEKEEDAEMDDDDDDILHNVTPFSPLRSRSRSVGIRNDPNVYTYVPCAGFRVQGFIKISTKLTEHILPQCIQERIQNVYDFMDKFTGIAKYDGAIIDVPNGKLLNYGFHHQQSGEVLYLLARKTKRNGGYVMKDEVLTPYQIYNMYRLEAHQLPQTWYNYNNLSYIRKKVNAMFSDSAALCQRCIFKTKWHKLPVFHTMNSNKEIKEFNKQRLTFSITKTEFIDVIERLVHNESKRKALIPIVMFNCNGYRVEYIQIVRIRNDCDIGISYAYNNNDKYSIKATGIHLNKNNILHQHQLADPHHDCHCLDDFQSIIDDLHIGNPDDDKNRVKDLQKKLAKFKNENAFLKMQFEQINQLKVENDCLKKLMLESMNSIQAHAKPPTPIITPVSSQFIALTPSSIALTPLVTPPYFTPSLTNNASATSITPQSGGVTFGQYAHYAHLGNNYHHCNVSNVSNSYTPQSLSSRASISNSQFLGMKSNANIKRNSNYCNAPNYNMNANSSMKSRST